MPWLYLRSTMNYPLCMIHDLATANRHDHAWTETWAQNICMLRKPLSLMRPWYTHQRGARRGSLYATKVEWKIYLTCFALLDMSSMIVLMWADRYVLIWAFSAVLTEPVGLPFSNIAAFRPKPEKPDKLLQCNLALLPCCSRNDACEAVW